MKCAQARRLFGAYWDDDTSRAEREWIEAHFTGCASCRREYEELAQVLELTASLPRVEPAPDLVERTLARARRAAAMPDRVPRTQVPWVPVTAAAALMLVAGVMFTPWLGLGTRPRTNAVAQRPAVTQPVLVQPSPAAPASEPMASLPDSIFDHSEDVEFILDPVTLRRGRATVARTHEAPTAEQAIITF